MSSLKAVQENCPVTCEVCESTSKPKIVLEQRKKVGFSAQLVADMSNISPADRVAIMKASFASVLSVDPANLEVVVEEVPGRRLQAGQHTYVVRCQVIVPPSVQIRSVIMQATSLSDPNSDAFSSLTSGMATFGSLDPSAISLSVTSKPFATTVTVAVNPDGSVAAQIPAADPATNTTNATGAAPAPSDGVVAQSCADSAQFVDEQGEGCSGWVGYDCSSTAWLRTERPYTAKGLLAVQGQCPLSCSTCSPPNRLSPAQLMSNCTDDIYIGLWCLRWRGINCSDATRLGYSPSYQQLLLSRCPLSCGLCGGGSPVLVDILDFQDELGYNCSTWRGSDCTQMYTGYTRKGMLTVQAACQDSCFGNQSRRLAPSSCADDANFSYLQQYLCDDFVGRICTYATLYLTQRWLLGPRAALAWHENIWSHCPVACGVCEPPERPTPADLFIECQDDPYIEDWCGYQWQGQDCLKWDQSVNLVVPHEAERFNATLFGRCPSTCRTCVPPTCQAGTYRNTRRHVCVPCALGSYMPTATSGPDALSCRLSRAGFGVTHVGSVAEEPCGLGAFAATAGQASCEACLPGRYAGSRAMKECIACQAGWFQGESGQSACKRCPRGTYTESAGMTACADCPAGFTTLLEASTGPEVCGCPPGQWRRVDSPACEDCAPGMFCPGGHGQFDTGPDMTAQLPPGMMSMVEDVASVYTCTDLEDTCPDYRPLPHTPELFALVCPGNRVGPRCSTCPKNWYLTDDGTCEECGADRGPWTNGLNILFAFAVGIYAAEACYRACERFRSEGQFMFWACVAFLQGLVPVIQMPIAWPTVFKVSFKVIITFSIPGLWDKWDLNFNFKCLVGQGFLVEMIKNLSIPLLVFINVGMLYLVFPLMRRRIQHPMALCTVATFWDGMWIALCVMAIMLFPTDTMPNGKVFLRYNPSVELGSPEWIACLPLGLGAILLYICTYIVIVIVGVCNAPRFAIEKEGFLDMFGFIIYVYTPEAYWWGLVLYVGNFTYTLIQVFGDPLVQIYASLFVILAMVLLELRVYPSVFPQMNRINVGIKTAHMFFVILAVCFVDTQAPEVKADTDRVPQVIIGIGLAVLILFLSLLAYSLFQGVGRRKWRAVHNQRMARKARAVMTLVTVMPEHKFIPAFKNMCDADWEKMREHNLMLTAVFLNKQSGRHWWQQRIIPDAHDGVYDQREVSLRAHELICERLVLSTMEENIGLHRLLDRLQDLIRDMSSEQLDPETHPVTTAVVASLRQDTLRRSVTGGGLLQFRKASTAGIRGWNFFRDCLPLTTPPSNNTWGSRGEPEAISLKMLEQVPISLQRFVMEFSERSVLTDADLVRLHQALDHERSGEVPLARIVAMVLSHAQSCLDDEGAGTGESEVVPAVDPANWRSLVPRMPGHEQDRDSQERSV